MLVHNKDKEVITNARSRFLTGSLFFPVGPDVELCFSALASAVLDLSFLRTRRRGPSSSSVWVVNWRINRRRLILSFKEVSSLLLLSSPFTAVVCLVLRSTLRSSQGSVDTTPPLEGMVATGAWSAGTPGATGPAGMASFSEDLVLELALRFLLKPTPKPMERPMMASKAKTRAMPNFFFFAPSLGKVIKGRLLSPTSSEDVLLSDVSSRAGAVPSATEVGVGSATFSVWIDSGDAALSAGFVASIII